MTSASDFARAFLLVRGEGLDEASASRIAAVLEGHWNRAALAWPTIDVDAVQFGRYVAERVSPTRVEAQLEQVEAGDLYLAFACGLGLPRALASFDEYALKHVPRFVARVTRSAEVVDDVRQRLRELLFVVGSPPKIFEYAGRGPLGGWVRVAAIRLAMNATRDEERASDRGRTLAVDERDAELDLLKARYAPEVQLAFEATLRALTTDQRNVLRMHYVDGLTMDEIGAAYDASRSTAARWIADARQMILDDTRRRLREAFAGTDSEIESLIRLVQSQLEMSLQLLLPAEAT
jgi:RNA polymerase sigma-70 factor (ECF subfamily)